MRIWEREDQPPRAVLIAGPTASGKSALALELAQAFGGEIINADSMQVYRDLRVLTARPSAEEEARAPHHLYGHRDAAENCSVGTWLADVAQALARVRDQKRLPIVVGGTGLYFRALTRGLAKIPPTPEPIRAAVRAQLDAVGPEALHAVLKARDPASAERLRPRDHVRITRALEVLEATGRPISQWQQTNLPPALAPDDAIAIFLAPERERLYSRINQRFHDMMDQGAPDEARALLARALDPTLPAMKAHGMPWFARHFAGEISREALVAGAQADTRHYAKRQMTWFRHQLPEFIWASPDQAQAALVPALRRVLRQGLRTPEGRAGPSAGP